MVLYETSRGYKIIYVNESTYIFLFGHNTGRLISHSLFSFLTLWKQNVLSKQTKKRLMTVWLTPMLMIYCLFIDEVIK